MQLQNKMSHETARSNNLCTQSKNCKHLQLDCGLLKTPIQLQNTTNESLLLTATTIPRNISLMILNSSRPLHTHLKTIIMWLLIYHLI